MRSGVSVSKRVSLSDTSAPTDQCLTDGLVLPDAARLGPEREEAGHADARHVDGARQHRVVDLVAAVDRLPHRLDGAQSRRRGVLLDQLLVLHDVELQVAHGELPGEPDFGLRLGRQVRRQG